MSIYIKGMEIPTSCRKCGLMMNCDDCEGWECYCLPLKKSIGHLEKFRDEPYVLTDKRRDDCPLLHVPKHGRLIDADALKSTVLEALNNAITDGNSTPLGRALCEFIAKNIVDEIEAAPTVIPADEEAEK